MLVLFLSQDLKYTGLMMNFGPVPFVPWGTSRRFGRSKNTQREGFCCPALGVGSRSKERIVNPDTLCRNISQRCVNIFCRESFNMFCKMHYINLKFYKIQETQTSEYYREMHIFTLGAFGSLGSFPSWGTSHAFLSY